MKLLKEPSAYYRRTPVQVIYKRNILPELNNITLFLN
jgi:hypothetical protein